MRLEEAQSAAVPIQALASADGLLMFISFKHQLLFINLTLVPDGQLVNSPTADIDVSNVYVEDINGSVIRAMQVNVNANYEARPWISYVLSIAHSWRLKNNNFLQTGLQYNLSFTKYTRGTYSINVPNQSITSGSYSSSGNYIAMFLRYTSTNGNYHLRRQYDYINSKSF